MDIIINETQYRKVLLETAKKSIEGESEKNKNLIKRIVSDVKKDFNLDLKFILTYSVTIGGLVGPVYEIMRGNLPDLSDSELSLITVGTIMTYYYNNYELLNRILILIRDNRLINEFNLMLDKTETLKTAFYEFIKSVGITFSSISNVLAFTFLLGVLKVLLTFAESNFTDMEMDKFIIGLSGYFTTLASKSTVEQIISKMIKRFSGENS